MREKELRLALICYGGISLAVYMHGITKEVWRLARASRDWHSGEPATPDCPYHALLDAIAAEADVELRVLVDILTGASAGGINAIFLAEAISTGRSLEPLTELWLDAADVDRLLDPGSNGLSRLAKTAALPLALAWSSRGSGAALRSVEPEHRDEVRAKLGNFLRARWLAPPFGGTIFTNLLLDALAAMKAAPAGFPLLPPHQPLDLFVTVTDFHGHPEQLRLHSPTQVEETEHRLTIPFRDEGGAERRLADPAELAFAARATASFPGAFPPFGIGELDAALRARGQSWLERDAFLARTLPRRQAAGTVEQTVLIDGSVLANAPFRPAIDALRNRPARREIDRRFVYIDPKPGIEGFRLGGGESPTPSFLATLFGALSDIPREQPIRDNLEAIDGRSARIRRLRHIVDAMRPEVEAAIERAFGTTILLMRPSPARLAAWRSRAQHVAAREAGYAYAAYAHLKLASTVEDMSADLFRLGESSERSRHERIREAVWREVRRAGLTSEAAITANGARADVIDFFRAFDFSYRTRRLRLLARRIGELDQQHGAPREALEAARAVVYALIGRYRQANQSDGPALPDAEADAGAAMAALADRLGFRQLDAQSDAQLSRALAALPKRERRALILTYLGYPFYDIATLPLLQGEGLDEWDPVKVDRISPDDATAIRSGGAAATLKGIRFQNFGAFFSRAYRENDYLWGRLHGADRLIEIVASALPDDRCLSPRRIAELKRLAFRAILDQETSRLQRIEPLLDELRAQIG